jgi:glycosyltransferase involved in cell wall biosynthesis
MRIAFVSTMGGAAWGGSEALWSGAALRAREAGHEVLASVYDHGSPPEQIAALARAGVRVDFRRKGIHRRIDEPLAALRTRFRALGRFDPDVVCVSQGASYEVAVLGDCEELRRWLGVTRAALVLVCQLNHDCVAISDKERERARLVFGRAARVAFVSERNKREAERHLAMSLPQAVVVRNPLNLESLEAVDWPARSEIVRWASVARLDVVYKGQDALMETLSDGSWKERDWRLSLFGRGPDEKYLRELAAHYGLTNRIVFAGHVANVRSIWADHEMLLLPSREEGAPLSMVEAMVCGRPALVTDVAGNTEWIDVENGFVATSARASALGVALESAWASRNRWREMGERARERALAQMSADAPGELLGLIESARSGAAADGRG